MYSIILDSSNTALTVGVAKDHQLIDSISYEAWQQQSEYMIPELNKFMEKYDINKDNIEDVIVAIGPGSYTGVRISITIAKTIAAAIHCKVYAISSLQAEKDGKNPSICVINARSNRSYIGVYENEKVIMNDCIMTNDEVKKYINEHPSYSLCGNASYLGLEGKNSNLAKEMLSLIEFISPIDNPLALKPVYMKD